MKAKVKSVRATGVGIPFPEFLEPVAPDKPCGNDLEYDPEFVVLLANAAPRGDAQYGDFVSTPEAVNWADLERDCRRILLRTRDIRVLILLLRCRTRLAQATGLRDGLRTLAHLLEKWPDAIHPQLMVDGEADPAMRSNALAALADPEGLMQDVRELAVADSGTLRLQIRDVERSLGVPRPADALAPESVRQQLSDLRQQHGASLLALEEAAAFAAFIDDWAQANLGSDCPELSPLRRLLSMVTEGAATVPSTTSPVSPAASPAEEGAREASDDSRATPLPELPLADMPLDRNTALSSIRAARQWFEIHEPSSPVALLLKQAEHLTGRRFDEVFQALPADLVERWARDDA